MIPIAALPAAAILMGIGYWVDPVSWGHDSQIAAFLIKSGGAILKNIPILFAVGIAFGTFHLVCLYRSHVKLLAYDRWC